MDEIETLAKSLVLRLNRKNIFPPLFNEPESFVPPMGSKPKKPVNSFIICRQNVCKEAKTKGAHNMRIISKATSILWRSATSGERTVYKNIANRVCEIHLLRNSTLINSTTYINSTANINSTAYNQLPSISPSISRQLPFPSPSSIFETSNMFFNDYNDQIIPFNYEDSDEEYHYQWI
ncbi:hypothetical protein RhiirA5_422215 [Rhizophagus irregularis]|uniref:MATA-HMG n=4 Tax=Rhizophagus irregularis TaxID=588596 RepID=A0A1B1EUR9_9GLOM|nr:hypothetical protein GLOIN_2v1877659 [Rhizophagus irregularis DAOM 181602=DAOM 197198]ANQ32546.1 MATA-HMG [Rhizophagus irregularis]EXX55045.1 hypothetical protein RirG_228910 [Rhizophagus irregularis DAOM 197198w]ANQ32547.1 MATA-HMG [Rhizophagus irregularis]PKC04473.1 hypothetical protein RhiirA5_422215 [Rhizophagus irregularis]PKY24079.1 hypothetical protein RhiirB3_438507 [Rhizophagus irregularis]|eukprot:XP_025176171.1 hypothetical protein GLOIN_2v1877659 [Rhizophagus irregularis DAOM 181602=DAOM 197198]